MSIALAASLLDSARATKPDLLVVNRFGRLESEGGGMLAEIGHAFADGLALIVWVPERFRDAWNAFAAGLDAKLPPNREAIEQWWGGGRSRPSQSPPTDGVASSASARARSSCVLTLKNGSMGSTGHSTTATEKR